MTVVPVAVARVRLALLVLVLGDRVRGWQAKWM